MKTLIASTAFCIMCGNAFALTVNLDATKDIGLNDYSKYIEVPLGVGDYSVFPIADVYTAYKFGQNPTDCDTDGANCGDGWLISYRVVDQSGLIQVRFSAPTAYDTPERALSEAQSSGKMLFSVDIAQTYLFGIEDGIDSGFDNTGGVSLDVQSIGSPAPIPLPATGLLLLTGLFGLAGRRFWNGAAA